MKISKVKWNRDELKNHIDGIEKNKDELSDNRGFLVNLRSEISDSFQGMAGQTFQGIMDIDIKNFDDAISELETLIDDLRKVNDQCYGRCEEEVKGLVSALSRKV